MVHHVPAGNTFLPFHLRHGQVSSLCSTNG
jgi:hypothetical protein